MQSGVKESANRAADELGGGDERPGSAGAIPA